MEYGEKTEILNSTVEERCAVCIGRLPPERFMAVIPLLRAYKVEIGEDALRHEQMNALYGAVETGDIQFFTAESGGEMVAVCSVSRTFSTFDCCYSGVFEDFYICPRFRKSGLATRLTRYVQTACAQQGIRSLWVGSADCDAIMYEHLGFTIRLGTLLCWTAD